MKWQPIETAPKGESRQPVLVYWANEEEILMAWWVDLHDEGKYWYTDSLDYVPAAQLTHWMPLPEPPKEGT